MGEYSAERWLPVAGFEGMYEVSDLGRVRSRKWSTRNPEMKPYALKPWLDTDGYLQVKLIRSPQDKNTRMVHILVAAAFIGPCPIGQEVNHKDLNPKNCAAVNLEYLTHRDNLLHAYRNGRGVVSGERHGRSKLTRDQVREIRSSTVKGVTLAAKFGVSGALISSIRKGKGWPDVHEH